MLRLFKFKAILIGLFAFITLFSCDLNAQVTQVDYQAQYNNVDCLWDFYIIIQEGSATSIPHRAQFNSQYSIVIPTGTTITGAPVNHMPLQNNQSYTGTTPLKWTIGTPVINPAASPGNDFYGITPTLSPASFYNNLATGDTVKIFSLNIGPITECGEGVRIFDNDTDPASNAPGMGGGDFSNGFTIGGSNQTYNTNAPKVDPPPPVISAMNMCTVDMFIDLDASTSTCQEDLTYNWTGPNGYTSTDEDVLIIGATSADNGTYMVTVTDAFGCSSELSVEGEVKPIANGDAEGCPDGSVTLQGSNPTTGTWTADPANIAGATLTPGAAGAATVDFNSSATGSYNFIYTNIMCSDTHTVNIIIPDAGVAPDDLSCFSSGTVSISADGTQTGVWSVDPSSAGTAVIDDPNSASTIVNGFSAPGDYTLVWTIGACSDQITFTTNDMCGCAIGNNILQSISPNTFCGSSGNVVIDGNTATPSGTYVWEYSLDGGTFASAPGGNTSEDYTTDDLSTGQHSFRRLYTTNTGIICSDTSNIVSFDVFPDPTAPSDLAASPTSICVLETTTLSVTNNPAATYTWTASSPDAGLGTSTTNTISMTPTASGTYTISVTQTVDGCESPPATIDVVVNDLPPTPTDPSTDFTDPTSCGADDGTITISGYNVGEIYTLDYSFNAVPTSASITANGAGNLILNDLAPGTYSDFSVTSAEGCSSGVFPGPVSLNDPAAPPTPSGIMASPNPECLGLPITITVDEVLGATYTWSANSPNAGLGTSTTNTVTMNATVAGFYLISVNQTINGCTSQDTSISISVNDSPPTPTSGTVSGTDPSVCGGMDGFISLSGYLNSTGYTVMYAKNGVDTSYVISSNGSGVITIPNLSEGTYSNFMITNMTGCSSGVFPGPISLADPGSPNPPANLTANPNPVCLGNTVTLSVTNTPGATFNWSASSPDAGLSASTGNSATMDATVAGTYTINVSVTVAGCTSSASSIEVVVGDTPATPSGITPTNPTTCSGTDGAISISGYNAGESYTLDYTFNGAAQSESVTADGTGNILISGLSAGIYAAFEVTNTAGCPSNEFAGPVELTDPDAPAPPTNLAADPNPICQGESTTATVDDVVDATYNWSVSPADSGFGTSTTNTISFTPVGSGVFVISVSLTLNGCTSTAANINFIVEPSPNPPVAGDISTMNPSFCTGNDGSISIANLDPGVSYGIQYDSSMVVVNKVITANGSGVATIDGLSSGSYSNFILTNSSGCSSVPFIGPVSLVDPGAPGAPENLTGTPNPSCLGTTVDLNVLAEAGATYMWSSSAPEAGLVSTTTNATTMTATAAGTYTIFVTQTIAGCTSPAAMIDIVVAEIPPTPTVIGVDPTDCGTDNGMLTISGLAVSTTYDLTYSIDGAPTTGSFTTDPDGEIQIIGLGAGDYSDFSVINSAGCASGIFPGPVTLVEPDAPDAPLIEGVNPTDCGANNGSIIVSGLEPNAVSSISYTFGGLIITSDYTADEFGQIIILSLAPGIYTNFSFVNESGCMSGVFAGPITLSEPNAPPAPTGLEADPGTICLGETIDLSVDLVSGAVYTWSASSTDAGLVASTSDMTTMTPTSPGSYTISVFLTLAGCSSTPISIEVTVDAGPPTPSNISSTDPTACATSDGTITLQGYTPSETYTVNYSYNGTPVIISPTATAAGDLEILFLPAGTYSDFSVENSSGCSSEVFAGPVVLTDPGSPAPPANLIGTPNPVCLGSTVQLSVDNTTGATYDWTISPLAITLNSNGSNTNSFTATSSGLFTVSVTQNIAGCTSTPATLEILILEDCVNPDFGVTYTDIPLSGLLYTNDSNNGSSVYDNVAASVSNPTSCMPSVSTDGSYTFTCSTPGEYEYTVDVCKVGQSAGCVAVPLVITVLDIENTDNPPVANHDYITTTTDNDVTIEILDNDKCQSMPSCVLNNLSVVIQPSFGTYDVNTMTYSPDNGYSGRDSFRYEVCQDPATSQNCDQEWVYIDIYPAASIDFTNAMDDYNQTSLNTTLTVDASNGVLSNDTDPLNSVQIADFPTVFEPGKGSITFMADGSYVFIPAADYVGPVDFEYQVCRQNNGSICESATLHLLVEPQEAAGSIESCVWEDVNANGILQPGEPTISGVDVNLYTADGDFVEGTTTSAGGVYAFDDVPLGIYYIEFIAPEDLEFTFPNVGNETNDSDVDDSNGPGTTALFTVDAGELIDDVKAGFYRCSKIGENVWYDIDEDDIYDDLENGINGLKVYLWRFTNGSYEIWDQTTTGHKPNTPSDDGWYQFCAPPGTYYIEIILPPTGLVQVIPFVGNNSYRDSDINNANGLGTTSSFTLNNGQDKLDLGAGYYPMAEAGNLVWMDENFDGIQDPNEAKLANVEVEIFNANTNDLIAKTTTDEDGVYHFDYLQKADVYFKFTPPTFDLVATIPDSGDDNIDSDVDHTYGYNTTRRLKMEPGNFNEHIDFGLAFGALPVEWVDVSVQKVKEGHEVEWIVEQEINVDRYEIQRSLDGISNFQTVSNSDISANNVVEKSTYNYVDKDELKGGTYYYRVKQYDFDGKFNYSRRVVIKKDPSLETRMYPNPTTSLTNIEFVAERDGKLNVSIYDVSGRLVLSESSEVEEGIGKYTLDTSKLPEGAYNISIELNNSVSNKRLIKIK